MQNTLKIGELAEQTGVSTDTLRYYEKHGLIKPSARSGNGYRLYGRNDRAMIEFIVAAKQVGFTLKEIRELIELEVTRDESTCAEVKAIVDDKLQVVEQRLAELDKVRSSLKSLSDACCGGGEPATHCTILDTLADREGAHHVG
jgi:MerR family Zn(II)-responsive transcriptional regulator of zntA